MHGVTASQLGAEDARLELESIYERNRIFYSDPRGIGALKDLQQTFPNPWLYVAELLQNAIDEGATRIAISVSVNQAFVFEHNGEAFSQFDVQALCARGVSAKGANTVGFMGVGFKSVFRSFEHVQISSGPWRFALEVPIRRGDEYGDQQRDWLGSVLPVFDTSVESPSSGMTCRFVLSRRLADLPPPIEDLSRVLGENKTLLPLLAWKGVRELDWNGSEWLLKRRESALDEHGAEISLESTNASDNCTNHWTLFSKTYQPSSKAIARFLEHRQLSPPADQKEAVYGEASKKREVAVFCETDSLGRPIPVDRGLAFAMLSTGITFPLGLHVQADWLLVVTRREMMQLEGNEWHEEILQQLPSLIRYYLRWLISKSSTPGWNRGYEALPNFPVKDIATDPWFGSKPFIDGLKAELEDLQFLPALRNSETVFVTPKIGRFLPKPLSKELEAPESHPDMLFGDGIINNRLLGARARQCLENLSLLQELSPEELSLSWKNLVVERWLSLFPGDTKNRKLVVVLEALSNLDERDEWRAAPLICLPTASGGWEHRGAVSRYPADWNTLAQEDDIRQALEPVLGSQQEIVSWDFDGVLQQTRSTAASYLDSVTRHTLEELTNRWWNALPESPSEDQTRLAIRFSAWILEKQPQRKRLIQKLLCLDQQGNLLLKANSATLLAEPYAGDYRRTFFPATPGISPIYESGNTNITRAAWHAFFENLSPAPIGRFVLTLNANMVSYGELLRYVKEYTPPSTRSSWMRGSWHGLAVQSDRYTVIDTLLPETVIEILKGTVTKLQFSAISRWLAESPSLLTEYRSVIIAYIPYMSGYVQTAHLPTSPQWVNTLKQAAWLYAKNGEGPFSPPDIIPVDDPARPNAPVVDLPIELVKIFETCGIQFGRALPDAPAIDRLRIQGATASASELVVLLQNAINEAGEDKHKKELLAKILRERNLFAVPPNWNSIDGSPRVSHSRLIRSDRPRSLLGNWLVAIDSFAEDSPEKETLELAASFFHVPQSAVFAQIIDFLSWVWNSTPDADTVRKILPRAYAYVREDLQANSTLHPLWAERIATARVFVQRKRKWVLANDSEVFFDDLNEAALEGVLSSIDIVTPGHLGETPAEQVEVASLLGLKLLSSRFEVNVEPYEAQTLPVLWQANFVAIQNWLRQQLRNDHEPDAETDLNAVLQQDFQLTGWAVLRTVVSESGARMQENEVKAAAWKDGMIAVSGAPGDFAEELCKVLFNEWGLRYRRDLVELIPRVAIQLTRIGDSHFAITPDTRKPTAPANQPPDSKSDGEQQAQVSTDVSVPSSAESTVTHDPVQMPPMSEEKTELEKTTGTTITGGSYTDNDRESRLRALIQKKQELERRIEDSLAIEISPDDRVGSDKTGIGEFRTDNPFREAALRFEEQCGRYAVAKTATQAGHDIDSYTHAPGHPDRRLIRRIEVKGRGLRWDSNEIVEMSSTQFVDSLNQAVEADQVTHYDFDYWLYVVEAKENGELEVLPIRNVAKRAARFALKGGSWRNEAEDN